MSVMQYLTTKPLFTLTKYDSSIDYRTKAIPFTGTPRKHPYDKHKIILIENPLGTESCFYEFKIDDIVHIEDKSNIGTESGELLPQKEIWVKKGSIGLRYFPFEVQDEIKFISDLKTLANLH